MVDNLAEKVDRCLLNRVVEYCLRTLIGTAKTVCQLYGSSIAECLLFRGRLSIEVNERTVGTIRTVRYIVAVEGCPLLKPGSTVNHHKHLTNFILQVSLYSLAVRSQSVC